MARTAFGFGAGVTFHGGLIGLGGGGGLSAALDLNFITMAGTGTLDARLTFARAGSATRVNASGVIELMGTNVPRWQYDPVTLSALGVLLEGQSTNLASLTEDFGNAGWSKASLTVSANAAADPSGGTGADKLIPQTNTSAHQIFRGAGSITAGSVYTSSIYAKADGYNWIAISVYDGGEQYSWFDLANGVTGTNSAGNTSKIERLGNGWYRCSATRTIAGASTFSQFFVNNAGTSGSFVLGDGVSGVLAWGAQIEAGSVATSYIPNTGTGTVTRAADSLTLTGTGLNTAIGAARNSFTVLIEWSQPPAADDYSRVLYLGTDDLSRRIDVYKLGSAVQAYVADGTVAATVAHLPPITAGAINKLAISVDGTNVRLVGNGSAGGTLASTFGGAAMAPTLRVLRSPLGSHINTTARRLTTYTSALTIAQMQALTT